LITEIWSKFLVWVKKFSYNDVERNDDLEKAIFEYRNYGCDNLETFFNDLLVDNNEYLIYDELMEGEKYIKYNLGVYDFLKIHLIQIILFLVG